MEFNRWRKNTDKSPFAPDDECGDSAESADDSEDDTAGVAALTSHRSHVGAVDVLDDKDSSDDEDVFATSRPHLPHNGISDKSVPDESMQAQRVLAEWPLASGMTDSEPKCPVAMKRKRILQESDSE